MLAEDKIREALSHKANEVVLPADLLDNLWRENGELILLTRWQRLIRILKHRTLVLLVGIALVGLLATEAAVKWGERPHTGLFPEGSGEIVEVKYNYGGGPWRHGIPLPLDPGHLGDQVVIDKLWGWLQAGEERGQGTHYLRGTPHLQILLRDGSEVGVGLPEGCQDCQEITAWRGGQSVRLYAPNLYDWLLRGFEADLRFGPRQ